MFTTMFGFDTGQNPSVPKEGDLFKMINLFGKTFEIRYGFYEERDRYARHAEPMEIYPDFLSVPQYTDDGIPFATAIQNPCRNFNGEQDENSTCDDCSHYQHCEELIGICKCPENRMVMSAGQNE